MGHLAFSCGGELSELLPYLQSDRAESSQRCLVPRVGTRGGNRIGNLSRIRRRPHQSTGLANKSIQFHRQAIELVVGRLALRLA